MIRDFKQAIAHRRSYYAIGNVSPVSDDEIRQIIEAAVKDVPSAFNSQTTRLMLLLGKHHKDIWEITKNTLKRQIPAEIFANTEAKINNCFAAGYGTVLFFEDKSIVKKLQESFPLYADKFPVWSQQTSAMHQFAVWTMLEDAGFGASLQHYNPLIDAEVIKTWNLNPEWELIAQMPFGNPLQEPGEKEYLPIGERVLVFK